MALKTWQNQQNQSVWKICKPGTNLEIYRPNQEGISQFRPIPRPYPAPVLALVPALLPVAKALLQRVTDPFSEQYEQELTALARAELAKYPSIGPGIVIDTAADLAHATRQCILVNNDTPQPMEWWRHGTTRGSIGGWALALNAALFWGTKSISILDHTTDHQDMPQGVFAKIKAQMDDAVKKGYTGFQQFIKDGFNSGPNKVGVDRTQQVCLMQVWLYQQNGRSANPPVFTLFMLNSTCLQSAEAQWNMPRGGPAGGPPKDFVNGYACGNLLDPQQGSMFSAFDQNANAQQQSQGAFGGAFSGKTKKGGGSRTNYVVQMQPGQPLPDALSMQVFRPWDDILYVPTREEAWMRAMEATSEDVVAYAGRDEIDLLPKTVRDRAKKWAEALGGSNSLTPGFVPGAPSGVMAPPPPAPMAPSGPALMPTVPGYAQPVAPPPAPVAAPVSGVQLTPYTPPTAGVVAPPPPGSSPAAPAFPIPGAPATNTSFIPAPAAPSISPPGALPPAPQAGAPNPFGAASGSEDGMAELDAALDAAHAAAQPK